jgi:hypothetical protein
MSEIKREDLVAAVGFEPIVDKQRREDYNAGRLAERAAIVAWLRQVGAGPSLTASALRKAADDIEKREHMSEFDREYGV